VVDHKEFTVTVTNDMLWNIPDLIAFLNDNQGSDICIIVNPEAHCLRASGFYDILDKFNFTSVQIMTHNQLEAHDRYGISKVNVGRFFLDIEKYDLNTSGVWNQTKIFGAFFGRPTANRLGIAAYLCNQYRADSEIIFPVDFRDPDQRALCEVNKLFVYDPDSLTYLANWIDMHEPKNLGYQPHGHLFTYDKGLLQLYANIFVDIISEPNIKGRTFFPTEKLVRPILMKKPFIAMASENYLEYVRQLGFYTFNEFWNEDYDGFAEGDRYIKILNLIDWLASKSREELEELYMCMRFQLEHNYMVAKNFDYNLQILEIGT
jgi:hypothetical protein